MKGDFTRDSFDSTRHFSRVLMQQGRVQLDADFNEQVAIVLHYLRTLAADLGGPYWGPKGDPGFEINNVDAAGDFTIGKGRYYVDGLLCENEGDLKYREQAGFGNKAKTTEWMLATSDGRYYVYLDVWERHITFVQDDRIREKALGGPDTCTRARIAWQIRLHKLGAGEAASCPSAKLWVDNLPNLSTAQIRARVRPERGNDDACSLPPASRYLGAENQLYRIELHQRGVAWNGTVGSDGKPAGNVMQAATFKWSRDNGSIVFPIVHQQGNIVTVQSLGRDARTSLKVGDWVEITDDDDELQGTPGILAQVVEVDLVGMTLTLTLPDDVPSSGFSWPAYDEQSANHPLLRRWDHQALEGLTLYQGAVLVTESSDPDNGWIEIEDGIEVQFQPAISPAGPTRYRTGDYWLIPARVATGKIEWPATGVSSTGTEVPESKPPHGIVHHYAPLAVITPGQTSPKDCRCTIDPLPCKAP